MDNGYAGSDPTILKAIPPFHSTPYLDNLLNLVMQPLPSLGSNLPLPGLYEAASRIKCEDVAAIFSRAAAHLHDKTGKHPELPFSSPSTCDLRALSMPSSILPMLATGDVTASSCNTFNYHDSSFYMLRPYLAHSSVVSTIQEQGAVPPYEPEGDNPGLVSPASFSEFMLHAMEISEASIGRLMPSSSLPPTTSILDQISSSTEGVSSSLMYSKLSTVGADVAGATANVPESPNSPSSKQESSVMSADDSDADRKIQSNNTTKRRNCGLRKTQPKKVVCIPFGENKQKAEAPPSDTWAWRKYGQKPIKGSPFPRGYYRCSSSKGCPARKQVERSRSDPTMVMVTYTADHNHPWPTNKSSNSSKAGIPNSSKDKSQGMEDTRSCQKVENLFSSIINSPNVVDEQVVSSMDSLQEEAESFFLQRDVDLCLSRTSTEGDDVFDNLGELPELSAIFSKGYGEGQFDEVKCEQAEFL